MALRGEVEKLDVELRKAAAAGFSVGVGGAGAAEESALSDETAALQQEAAARVLGELEAPVELNCG